jgi:hypothetical protein
MFVGCLIRLSACVIGMRHVSVPTWETVSRSPECTCLNTVKTDEVVGMEPTKINNRSKNIGSVGPECYGFSPLSGC